MERRPADVEAGDHAQNPDRLAVRLDHRMTVAEAAWRPLGSQDDGAGRKPPQRGCAPAASVVVAYNALHVRPGVYDGAATFSLNVVQQLPEVLPAARIVAYVAEGEDRLEPRPNLELRPVGEGRVHAPGRLALETLWLTVDLRRIGASALISPHESIPLRAPAPVVVVAQNLIYHRHGVGDAFVGRERRERLGATSRLATTGVAWRRRTRRPPPSSPCRVTPPTCSWSTRSFDRSKTVVVHEGSDSMFLGSPEVPETRQQRLLAVSTLAP